MLNRRHLFRANSRKMWCRQWIEQRCSKFMCCLCCCVGWRGCWYGGAAGTKFDIARDPFGAGLGDVTPISLVMFGGMVDIPALNTMWCPRSLHLQSFMNEHLCSWRGHQCFIVVKCPIHMGFGRQLGIGVGAAEKIEGGCSLFYKAIPEVERELRIGAG